ncbi:MAG: hypothetical protein HC840_18770 [Leptolyngbyaceae cyanobacterium RM2_2_4]|nr:hypothetical protein [Leptolyngbyaceae cyanobacterium SM1_4_3]NJN90078.1 hypothetical protein [Leptolyngbyaceae cyanobacterium SL_5_14]NJO51140.1 hypothetical protein [Leptolyngbyaceae cyanobacterium RM2_2_4]
MRVQTPPKQIAAKRSPTALIAKIAFVSLTFTYLLAYALAGQMIVEPEPDAVNPSDSSGL